MIDINETIKVLCRKYSAFSGRVQYDVSARGENFATLTMPNEKNPNFPMTVMLYEKGYALVSVGNSSEALRCESESALIETIQDILGGKVYFTLRYESDTGFDICRVCASRIDTDEDEYRKYIASLEKQVTFFEKFFGASKGIFETTDWSGALYRVIRRGIKERN